MSSLKDSYQQKWPPNAKFDFGPSTLWQIAAIYTDIEEANMMKTYSKNHRINVRWKRENNAVFESHDVGKSSSDSTNLQPRQEVKGEQEERSAITSLFTLERTNIATAYFQLTQGRGLGQIFRVAPSQNLCRQKQPSKPSGLMFALQWNASLHITQSQ